MKPLARVAFDIGGTFTDIVVIGSDGRLRTYKPLSLPEQIGAQVRAPIEAVLRQSEGAELASLVHGTTIAANAIIEGKGAVTALLTTRGFRDELEIRRMARPPVFDFGWQRLKPLIPRRRRLEVNERITADGHVFMPLDLEETRHALRALRDGSLEALAICFINSYVNPVHEQQAAALARELLPDVALCTAHEVLPEIREYERASTTAVNACLMPLVGRYLDSLDHELGDNAAHLRIMQSNGGVMTVSHARHHPIYLLESGPAAGVLGAAALAAELGIERAVSFDMGGTTVKACLIENSAPLEKNEMEVGGQSNIGIRYSRGAGYALSIPALDIVEAGAGGGSLAWIDEGGTLRVGPASAGAVPGPACYGRGGRQPTITDANVVLGYMNARAIAGGMVTIDHAAASAAIERELCPQLKLPLQAVAYGIYQVANAAMMRAVRAVTTERGRDPRDYTLLAFGGAGPLHAAALAAALGIRQVLVPLFPGLFSAFGLMMADLRYDYVQSIPGPLDSLDHADLMERYETLRQRVYQEIGQEKIDTRLVRLECFLDLRYERQTSPITLRVPDEVPPPAFRATLAAQFHQEHERNFGYRRENEAIAIVNLRVKATAPANRITFAELAQNFLSRAAREADQGNGARPAWFGPALGERQARIMRRSSLLHGEAEGPAVIEEFDTTVVVPPGWRASLDRLGNIMLQGIG